MGSKGCGSEASAAVATRSASLPKASARASRMRFSVSVPVLSQHSTVAEPSVSIAGMRRVSTPWRAMRHAPNARNTVSTTGNSSGTAAMASVRPASIAPSGSPRFAT